MKVFWAVIWIGLIIVCISASKKNAQKENKREDSVCKFDGGISKEEFRRMVKRSGKGIHRITYLEADGSIVYGTVRSQSSISYWQFRIDFNDYGNITGKYWISSDNENSDIPKTIADRIAQQICNYSNGTDDFLDDEIYQEGHNMKLKSLYCPNCGGALEIEDGLDTFYCKYCGYKILLEGQSKAAYEAKVQVKHMEHQERLQESHDALERYRMESEQKSKKQENIRDIVNLVVLVLILALLLIYFH